VGTRFRRRGGSTQPGSFYFSQTIRVGNGGGEGDAVEKNGESDRGGASELNAERIVVFSRKGGGAVSGYRLGKNECSQCASRGRETSKKNDALDTVDWISPSRSSGSGEALGQKRKGSKGKGRGGRGRKKRTGSLAK